MVCPLRELVMAADIVKVAMGRDRQERPFRQQGDLFAQGDQAAAAVDQEVAASTAQVPDVAAIIGLDVRFVDPGYLVRQLAGKVPGGGGDDAHGDDPGKAARSRKAARSVVFKHGLEE